ncbi:ribonuclease H-like domain-containing protein [Ganoderma leucocontextum]|nr:ribonuclease H-like domain-containing protein [Ganoderma leucocontextum]
MANTFRVFAPDGDKRAAAVKCPPRPYAVPGESVEVFTDGSCQNDETGAPQAGSGAWFQDGDARNVATRVPGPVQSNQAAEIHAVAAAITKIPPFVTAHVVTDSKYVMQGMTTNLPRWEDVGWLGIKNAPLMQDLAARLRARSAPTTFRWVKGHTGVVGNEKADALARAGAEAEGADYLPPPDMNYVQKGVKLTALTQKLAYLGIRKVKQPDARPATTRNLQRAISDVKTHLATVITDRQIWKAVRHRDMNRRVRDFWWKLLHNAHRVGRFWTNIPGYEGRAVCRFCGETDTMEHILLDCRAPGREVIWNLALDTIAAKCGERLELTFGTLLAAPCMTLSGLLGKRNAGADRLARIVLTESAHLIWTLRCERVIEWGDEQPARAHAAQHIVRVWRDRINRRIRMDQLSASPRWQRKAVPRQRVQRTWHGVLEDAGALPPDWIRVPGVLVGIPRPERRAGVG